MKSTFYRKVCGESTITVNLPANQVIDNLRQLSGECRSTDTEGCELLFSCSQDGRISMCSSSLSKICIRGTVEDNNGKTVIKFYELYDHSNAVTRWGLFALNSLWLVFYFIFDFKYFWLFLIWSILLLGAILGVGLSEKRNATIDLPIMKEELLRKIEAAEKWDK